MYLSMCIDCFSLFHVCIIVVFQHRWEESSRCSPEAGVQSTQSAEWPVLRQKPSVGQLQLSLPCVKRLCEWLEGFHSVCHLLSSLFQFTLLFAMFITTLGHISLGVFLAMHGSPAVAGIISNGMLVSGMWAEAYNLWSSRWWLTIDRMLLQKSCK